MNELAPTTLARYRGCLLGGAVGDALGSAIEFDSIEAIRARFGPDGIADPAEAYGRVGAFTDDTQMTLFTAEGLLQADDARAAGTDVPLAVLWRAYQRWLVTQDEPTPLEPKDPTLRCGLLYAIPELYTRREPGLTSVSALRVPRDLDTWNFRAHNKSKGCGGVMRAAPCGLVGERWGAAAAFALGVGSAALTHGHPSGPLAAGALAVIVHALCAAQPLDAALDSAERAIGEVAGGDEVLAALRAARGLASTEPGSPAALTGVGEGWVAEEALAIAVYCVCSHPDDFEGAVRLAVNHSGDSDSTAAIAGNIAGTLLGADAIPDRWLAVLELEDRIDQLAEALHRRFIDGEQDVGWWLTGSDLVADLARRLNAGEPCAAELTDAIRQALLVWGWGTADDPDRLSFSVQTIIDGDGNELLPVFTSSARMAAFVGERRTSWKIHTENVPDEWLDMPVALDPGCEHSLTFDMRRVLDAPPPGRPISR